MKEFDKSMSCKSILKEAKAIAKYLEENYPDNEVHISKEGFHILRKEK